MKNNKLCLKTTILIKTTELRQFLNEADITTSALRNENASLLKENKAIKIHP